MNPTSAPASGGSAASRTYHVTALEMTVYFNREGDHDHNGLIYALTDNVPILKYLQALAHGHDPAAHRAAAQDRATLLGVSLPQTPAAARQPHPVVRPLVLRACVGETVRVELQNDISNRSVGIHLVAGGYDVRTSDGTNVSSNPPSVATGNGTWTYAWHCGHQGVFPFHDGHNYSGARTAPTYTGFSAPSSWSRPPPSGATQCRASRR